MPTRTKAARPASCFCVPLSLVHHLGFVPCAGCYPASYVHFPAFYAGLFCSFSGMLCRRSPSILPAFYAALLCLLFRILSGFSVVHSNPSPSFPSPALAKCALAKTFFCGWGPQKHEQGALCFLLSSIRHSSAIRIAKGVRLPSFLVLITLY